MLSSTTQSINIQSPMTSEPLRAYLVEDSPMIRANLTTTLEELCGIKVVATAESEKEAVNWLLQPEQNWRLAIVDVFLNKGLGLKVLSACKNRRPDQKMVVLTNFATPDMRKACLNMGADAVFDKSNELEALIEYCSELTRH